MEGGGLVSLGIYSTIIYYRIHINNQEYNMANVIKIFRSNISDIAKTSNKSINVWSWQRGRGRDVVTS